MLQRKKNTAPPNAWRNIPILVSYEKYETLPINVLETTVYKRVQ